MKTTQEQVRNTIENIMGVDIPQEARETGRCLCSPLVDCPCYKYIQTGECRCNGDKKA